MIAQVSDWSRVCLIYNNQETANDDEPQADSTGHMFAHNNQETAHYDEPQADSTAVSVPNQNTEVSYI